MNSIRILKNYEKIHFIGVGGISMSGIANYLLRHNKMVSGSDRTLNNLTDELSLNGAKIFKGHDKSNLSGADAIVVTSAIDKDNPELVYAMQNNIPIFKRSEVLGSIIEGFSHSVAVGGCHGKTTATAMISRVLLEAGKDPTVFLGGEDKLFGNFRLGNSEYVVSEACEFRKNLIDVKPKISVVLNVDNDHMDSYENMNELKDTFQRFIDGKLAVLNADDKNSETLFNSTTVTFGIDNQATYTAKNVKCGKKGYSFTLCAYSRPIIRVNLSVMGRHNIYNALAAFAVADLLNVSPLKIKKGLEGFDGVKRRNEFLGKIYDIGVYADYAHHPKEIECALKTFRENFNKVITVFQPHTYSRTKTLMKEFVNCLKFEDRLVIYDTYAAREKYDFEGSAEKLYENLKDVGCDCKFINKKRELIHHIENSVEKDAILLFLGAGDVYQTALSIINKD